MQNRQLLHVLVIFALVFSELAASVHLVGHLHQQEHPGDLRNTVLHSASDERLLASNDRAGNFQEARTGLTHATHSHQGSHPGQHRGPHHHDHDGSDDHAAGSDCSIYHVYASLQGCVADSPSAGAQRYAGVPDAPVGVANTEARTMAASRIRGPPPISCTI